MWIVALIGGATSFIECTLAQIYKVRSSDGKEFRGGPSYYISKGLGLKWLAVLFSAVALFATTFCLHLPNISTLVDLWIRWKVPSACRASARRQQLP